MNPAIRQSEECCQQFCYHPKTTDHGGWLNIEHERVLLDALEPFEKSAALVEGAGPTAPTDNALRAKQGGNG